MFLKSSGVLIGKDLFRVLLYQCTSPLADSGNPPRIVIKSMSHGLCYCLERTVHSDGSVSACRSCAEGTVKA